MGLVISVMGAEQWQRRLVEEDGDLYSARFVWGVGGGGGRKTLRK